VFHAYMPLVTVQPMAMAAAPLVAGIPRNRCHVRLGEVAEALGSFARRSGTDIVVVGAVSRSAIARLFIGNTAERTLDHLTCDVLIVKPRGFRSGIERAPAVAATGARLARRRLRRSRGAAIAARSVPPPFL
jgi:hypothetical protein